MSKSSHVLTVLLLVLVTLLPGAYRPNLRPASAYAPLPAAEPNTHSVEAASQASGPITSELPSPGTLPPEVEEARARQAMEAVIHKFLQHFAPHASVTPLDIALEGDWAHGLAEWHGQADGIDGPVRVLAHRLPQGEWQALMPSTEGLYLQWVEEVPETLVSSGAKEKLRSEAPNVDAFRESAVKRLLPPTQTNVPQREGDVSTSQPATPTTAVATPTPGQKTLLPQQQTGSTWVQAERASPAPEASQHSDQTTLEDGPGESRRLLVARQLDDKNAVFLVDPLTKSEETIVEALPNSLWLPMFERFVTLSPDGRFATYVVADDLMMTHAQLWLVALDDGSHHLLGEFANDFWIAPLVWSPDSTQIALVKRTPFSENQSGIQLWTIDVGSGEQRQLISDPTFHPRLFRVSSLPVVVWPEDGSRIIFTDYHVPQGLKTEHLLDISSGSVRASRRLMNEWENFQASILASLPCAVSQFSQNDPEWANDVMQYCGDTIGTSGCAVTSTAMVFRYYAVETSPRTLNQCLGSSACPLAWSTAASDCSSHKASWLGSPGFSWGTMESELSSGRPPILDLNCGSYHHFVTVVSGGGTSYSGYTINDPWDGQVKSLQSYSSCSTAGLRLYSGSPWCQSSACAAPSLTEPGDGAVLSNRTITFRWNAVSGCTFNGYTFRVCTSADVDNLGNCFIDTGEGSTQRTETISGRDYQDLYWGVKAANAPSGANWAVRRFRIEPISPPSAPTLQSPTNGSTFNEGQGITLSWSATGDEYDGEIWGGPAGTTSFGWQTGTSKAIGSQWAGYTYSWHVKARNNAGESGWSSTWTFTVRPAAPSNLSAQTVSCNQVNLAWSDNSGNEDGYKIYRDGAHVATVGANVTSYQNTGLSGSSTYSFYVKAYRGTIESAASNTVSVATPACGCPTITEWKGEYWSNPSLSGSAILCRNDFALDFDWGLDSPDPLVPVDGFSARWTRTWDFPSGIWRFHMLHDDGARLYIDDITALDKWGTCCAWDTVDVSLNAGSYTVQMEMYENGGAAGAALWWERLDVSGWRGEYYNNDSLSGHPILVRDDGTTINFEWVDGSPDPLVQRDHFSVRWTRSLTFGTGTYRFDIFHDDGARLYIDDVLVFENWCNDCRLTESFDVPLTAGVHNIKLEVFENGGWAAAQLTCSALSVCDDAWEPNDDPAHATSMSYGQSKSAMICGAGDVDYYQFEGHAGDPVVIDIDAAVDGSRLDSYIYLAKSDGSTVLAENDDAGGSLDSKLGYILPEDDTYYIKVRAYSHPSDGGSDYFYSIRLFTDTVDPSFAEITTPSAGDWLDPDLQTIVASATDNESGISRVEFLWHDADWDNTEWVWLGADAYGANGWTWDLDTSALPEQRGCSIFMWAFDWVGHWTGASVGNLGIDRAAPTGSIQIEGGAEVVNKRQVILALSANDANGVTDMRLQNDGQAWSTWEGFTERRLWTLPDSEGEHTVAVQFRDVAGTVSAVYADTIILESPANRIYLPIVVRSR